MVRKSGRGAVDASEHVPQIAKVGAALRDGRKLIGGISQGEGLSAGFGKGAQLS
jgi:hypothetical protein